MLLSLPIPTCHCDIIIIMIIIIYIYNIVFAVGPLNVQFDPHSSRPPSARETPNTLVADLFSLGPTYPRKDPCGLG